MLFFLLQYDSSNEGQGQVGGDGWDGCVLHWGCSHGAWHCTGGQQLPRSGIHWNIPRWVIRKY